MKIKDDCGAINETGTAGSISARDPRRRDRLHDSRRPFHRRHQVGPIGLLRAQPPDREGAEPPRTGHDPPALAAPAAHRGDERERRLQRLLGRHQVNFFRSALGQGCANTGEIAAIFDHEWGHGVDNNGVDPSIANPGESIADMYAMLRGTSPASAEASSRTRPAAVTATKCIGTPQDGCTGVRDIDFASHRCDLPHTISWVQTASAPAVRGGSERLSGRRRPVRRRSPLRGLRHGRDGLGPDDPRPAAAPFNYDSQRAHEVAARLIYLGAQPVCPGTRARSGGGCSATGGYLSLLAVDDDNGDITDGTPT